jgi:F-type H+-transporting ATPase subunit b
MAIDWLTVIAQIVNFLILAWLLKRFLYAPVIAAMQKREERIRTRLAEAQQREEQAEAAHGQYQRKLADLDRARDDEMARILEELQEDRRRRLEEVRYEIDQQRARWQEELRREQEEMRKELRRQLGEAALDVARRALADMADARMEEQIVATFLRQWQRLPEDQRAPFAETGEPLRVATSFDLDEHAREQLRKAFADSAGIEFTQDPELSCGIALIGAGHRLDWNFHDYLDDVERRFRAALTASSGNDPDRP